MPYNHHRARNTTPNAINWSSCVSFNHSMLRLFMESMQYLGHAYTKKRIPCLSNILIELGVPYFIWQLYRKSIFSSGFTEEETKAKMGSVFSQNFRVGRARCYDWINYLLRCRGVGQWKKGTCYFMTRLEQNREQSLLPPSHLSFSHRTNRYWVPTVCQMLYQGLETAKPDSIPTLKERSGCLSVDTKTHLADQIGAETQRAAQQMSTSY